MRSKSSRFHLSNEERDRLRPTVDVGALERFLAVVPTETRRFYFLACAQAVSDAELEAIGIPFPPLPQESGGARPVPATKPDGQSGTRGQFLPARHVHFVLHHVPDPELDRLWQEVEHATGGGKH